MVESEMDAWTEMSTGGDEVTVKHLTGLCEKLVKARESKEELSEQLKVVEESIHRLEAKILTIMKENVLPSFKSDFGSISIRTVRTVAQPENLEKKLEFFEYLKDLGVFEQMVSVNSRTLSSWANREIEAKEQEGVFGWAPPGLKKPNEYQALTLRKK